MILTGKAAECAESFEALDREQKKENPDYELIELDEQAQIDLFNITMMYERDAVFHSYIRGCTTLFARARVKGPQTVLNLATAMAEVEKCLK